MICHLVGVSWGQIRKKEKVCLRPWEQKTNYNSEVGQRMTFSGVMGNQQRGPLSYRFSLMKSLNRNWFLIISLPSEGVWSLWWSQGSFACPFFSPQLSWRASGTRCHDGKLCFLMNGKNIVPVICVDPFESLQVGIRWIGNCSLAAIHFKKNTPKWTSLFSIMGQKKKCLHQVRWLFF